MHRGWTKRWRRRWDKKYHRDFLLWMMMDYFIDHANHKDSEVFFPGCGLIPLKRGQHIFGTPQLADFLGVDRNRIRRKLKILKNINFLTIKTTNKYSIATVINYDTYQEEEDHNRPAEQPGNDAATDQQPTSNRPHLRIKELKNNNITPSSPPSKNNGKSLIPSDFQITEKMQSWFLEQDFKFIEIKSATAQFCDYWKSQGKMMKDWEATWRNGMRNAEKWAKKDNGDGKEWIA